MNAVTPAPSTNGTTTQGSAPAPRSSSRSAAPVDNGGKKAGGAKADKPTAAQAAGVALAETIVQAGVGLTLANGPAARRQQAARVLTASLLGAARVALEKGDDSLKAVKASLSSGSVAHTRKALVSTLEVEGVARKLLDGAGFVEGEEA